jgi:hypothetical protein
MEELRNHFTDDSIKIYNQDELGKFNDEKGKSIYVNKFFNKSGISDLQTLDGNMKLILIKDETSPDSNVKEPVYDLNHYKKKVSNGTEIDYDNYLEYKNELDMHAKANGKEIKEIKNKGRFETASVVFIDNPKPLTSQKKYAIYNEHDFKENIKGEEIDNFYENEIDVYKYHIDKRIIPEDTFDKNELEKYHKRDKSSEYFQLYHGGKRRKSRRNRKSKKGKKSRKARKSRRKSKSRR